MFPHHYGHRQRGDRRSGLAAPVGASGWPIPFGPGDATVVAVLLLEPVVGRPRMIVGPVNWLIAHLVNWPEGFVAGACFVDLCFLTSQPMNQLTSQLINRPSCTHGDVGRPLARPAPLGGNDRSVVGMIKQLTVSTAQLKVSLPLHLRPINPVVYRGSLANAWNPHLEGGFPLRCLQRLSLPNLATQLWSWQTNWHTRGSSNIILSY